MGCCKCCCSTEHEVDAEDALGGLRTENPNFEDEHPDERLKTKFKESSEGWTLYGFSELPSWMQDNEFILSGYRKPYSSVKGCLYSLFRIHNETVNVWSHLGPMIAIFVATPFIYNQWGTSSSDAGAEFLLPFLCGAMICLSLSGVYHLFNCNGKHTHSWLNKLDYVGITLLIVGSFYPFCFYAFYCQPTIMWAYLGSISGIGFIVTIFVVWPRFATPEYRKFRAMLFSILGLSGVVPAIHFAAEGCADPECRQRNVGLAFLLSMAASYLVGAVFYAKRFPEKHFPGKFDLFLSSHQIFHILVVVGVMIHFAGALWMRDNRLNDLGACPIID